MKQQRRRERGGRKRAFKTERAYRLHLHDEVKAGYGTYPDGTRRLAKETDATFRDLRAGSKLA